MQKYHFEVIKSDDLWKAIDSAPLVSVLSIRKAGYEGVTKDDGPKVNKMALDNLELLYFQVGGMGSLYKLFVNETTSDDIKSPTLRVYHRRTTILTIQNYDKPEAVAIFRYTWRGMVMTSDTIGGDGEIFY